MTVVASVGLGGSAASCKQLCSRDGSVRLLLVAGSGVVVLGVLNGWEATGSLSDCRREKHLRLLVSASHSSVHKLR